MDLKLEKLLYVFVCSDIEKLKEIYEDDKLMKKVVKKIEYFTREFDSVLYYDRDALYERAAKAEGYEAGMSDGMSKGEDKKQKQIISKMKKLGYSNKQISEIIDESDEHLSF